MPTAFARQYDKLAADNPGFKRFTVNSQTSMVRRAVPHVGNEPRYAGAFSGAVAADA